jgi:thiosulfate dehydrogenase [quinone] large subunit
MIVLALGAICVEHFNLIGDQLVHGPFLAIVMAFGSHNRYSVDRLLVGHRSTGA